MVLIGGVVVFAPAASAGGGCRTAYESGPTEAAGTTVVVREGCFTPTVLLVAPGADVTFTNTDVVVHALHGVGWGGPDQFAVGASFTRKFEAAGTYPYSCYLHPGMSGAVVVGDGRMAAAGAPVELAAAGRPDSAVEADNPILPESGVVPPALVLGAGVLFVGGAAFAAGRVSRRSPPPT